MFLFLTFVDLMPFLFISFRVSTLYTFTFLLRMLTLYTVRGQGVEVMIGECVWYCGGNDRSLCMILWSSDRWLHMILWK